MLATCDIVAFVGTANAEGAKTFYRDVLGLRLVSADRFALVFDANGIMLRVTPVADVAPAQHTVLGWSVPDIGAAIGELAGKGVQFERYGFMPENGPPFWTARGGAKVAWFKDPDGNVLSLTEFGAAATAG